MKSGHGEDARKTTGWAIHDFTLSVATLNAMARNNPHVAFPASGDAKRRPVWKRAHHHRTAATPQHPESRPAMSTTMTTATGKRAEARTPYLEAWAQRYHRSQLAIERARLKAGKAKHRAHRNPLPAKPGQP